MDEENIKKEITSLDIRFLIKELRHMLAGGMIRKIYQYGTTKTKQFLFDVFVPGKESQWLYVDGSKIFVTRQKQESPQEPPSFCMFLRKYLIGKKIRDIKQHEFDRIVEIHTDDNILIFEMFSKGNVILCTSSYKIIMPLEIQRWKDREIRSKVPYKYPPRVINPFDISYDVIMTLLKKADKKLISMLAKDLGLGGLYASEICTRADVDENKQASDVSLHEALQINKVIEKLDNTEISPCLYRNVVSPFPLSVLSIEPPPGKTETFSEALDTFFSTQILEKMQEEEEKKVDKAKEKEERILEQQEEAKEKWEGIQKESKDMADLIYQNYTTVESVIKGIRKAHEMGMSWNEIKEKITSEDSPETQAIKEIREGDGHVILELDEREVEIDFRKTVEENAAMYYEDSKWARGKMQRTMTAIGETQERIEETPEEVAATPELKVKKERKRWYERFKWFISSDGFLVVAGRSADQNETLLKKHSDSTDVVFHADIPGAAFVVIKSEGKEPSDVAIKEASEFSAANSKAWNKSLGTIDVFCVRREQVSKTPPSGEYLPKGAFVVTGERVWFRDMELKLSIGVKLDKEKHTAKVISGPVMSVRTHSNYFITIKPGFKKSLDLARAVKNKLLIKASPEDKPLIETVQLEDIQNVVPAGMGDIVEFS
ncbi:MAG: ribosome rescue protein RqcH [Candidatus Aenigmatarchaeota archaeon]